MTRASLLPIAILLACAGMLGTVYLHTRPHPAPSNPLEPQAARPGQVVHLDRVAQAVAKTSSVKSFRYSVSMLMTDPNESLTLRGEGSLDLEHKLSEMTMRIEDVPAGSPATQPVDFVFDYSSGFVEYMRWAVLDGHLPAGKSWLKIDIGKLARRRASTWHG